MPTKICTKCKEEKPIESFPLWGRSKDGYASECKDCHNDRHRKYYQEHIEERRIKGNESAKKSYRKHLDKNREKKRKYWENRPEKRKANSETYRKENKEHVAQYKKEYNNRPDVKERTNKLRREKYHIKRNEILARRRANKRPDTPEQKQKKREYYLKNKERIQAYKHQYYLDHVTQEKERTKRCIELKKDEYMRKKAEYVRNNPQVRIAHSIRTAMGKFITGKGKKGKFRFYVGCDQDFLLNYLESFFTEGMTRENYGNRKNRWTVDHVIPLAYFDLTDEEQKKKAFYYTNCRPMWYPDNCSKGAWYNGVYYHHKKAS